MVFLEDVKFENSLLGTKTETNTGFAVMEASWTPTSPLIAGNICEMGILRWDRLEHTGSLNLYRVRYQLYIA
jgi:hypothetical protein